MQNPEHQKKRPRGRPFVKGDERINRKGAPPKQSFRAHFDLAFDDNRRRQIAAEYARQAAKGSIQHLEVALRLLGEGQSRQLTEQRVNVLALLNAEPELRAVATRLFTALALGAGDAGGVGMVREPDGGPE